MRYLLILIFSITWFGCSKSAGVGGKATIMGTVEAIYIQKGSFDTLSIEAIPDYRVYIVYGDGNLQDDDTRTSPNGGYKFEYLNPGDYKIYSFSESLVLQSGLEEVSTKVTIGKKDTEVTAPKLTIIQYIK
tara:strand:+ start:159505 stop:159897 length:393 start_codon:yes stop_codon:yes gene_type:complete